MKVTAGIGMGTLLIKVPVRFRCAQKPEEKSKTNPDVRIIMKADSETPHGMIAAIKEVLGNAGFTDVIIQVDGQ